jgi:CHAD domain-containing protein
MPKWLPDVSPDDRTADVAARALANRLDAVRRYLKRVARTAGAEDAHQLRVCARRAGAALRLYADLLPPRDVRWFRKWLKRLRKAAGRVRDSDVLARRVTGPDDRRPDQLRSVRRRGVKKVRRLADQLGGGRRLRRRAQKLLACVGEKLAGAERFGERARATLRPLVETFFAACPPPGADDAALHRFRIRGKELRYALELLAGAFPPALRDDLYPILTTLQERLGLVNDLATAQRRVQEWLNETGDPATVSHLRRRQAAVGEELVRAQSEFQRWWTPELRDALRRRSDEFLGSPSGPR